MKNKLLAVELFAGVGGFRLGLEGWKGKSPKSSYRANINSKIEVIWSNQWEPSTKKQHASEIYEFKWGSLNHSNADISKVSINEIPDHDLLVGGFPCQDYSVARVLSQSKGLVGKKGVLWWEIHRILKDKKNKKPKFLILENVDRLINSPSTQRGRDFSIILASLSDLGYAVEWRIINAADYGFPQKRKRVFILGYLKGTNQHKKIKEDKQEWLLKGTLGDAFPISIESTSSFIIDGELDVISDDFNKKGGSSPYYNSGVMIDRDVLTSKVKSTYDGKRMVLKDILEKEDEVASHFYIDANDDIKSKWAYMKGAKKEMRKRKDGNLFNYSEGSMAFPDNLNAPSRTIITSEGGKTPSRSTHVINNGKGLRRLTPVELERLNMFPKNHTKHESVSNAKRGFLMGNALVVGVVEEIAKRL